VNHRLSLPCALILAFGLALSVLPLPAQDEAPLTEVDIVRRVMAGTDAKSLIELIGSSTVAFDISQEMQEELALAGVPARVIQAMVAKQREQDGPGAGDDAEPIDFDDAFLEARLFILLDAGEPDEGDTEPTLRIEESMPPPLAEELRLKDDEARFSDVGIFLICRTADHVPDHWRSQTPLGRDFNWTPRHRLLEFVSGATRREPGKVSKTLQRLTGDALTSPGVLELTLPNAIEVEMEPGVVHDISLGLALEAGGRFYMLQEDRWDGLLVEGDRQLRAVIDRARKSEGPPVQVRFEREAETGSAEE